MATKVKSSETRKAAKAAASEMIMTEIGDSALKRFGGTISEEFLNDLRGLRGLKKYNEMRRNDDAVGPMLRVLSLFVRNVTLHVVAANKDLDGSADLEKANETATFVESCIDDMSCSFDQIVTDILTMLWAGFAPLEITYKVRRGSAADPQSQYDDGMIGWRKMSLRGQESIVEWKFDEGGGLQAMKQALLSGKIVEIPIDKILLFRIESEKNNPEGVSLLRNAYRPWFYKRRFEELLAIGVERDLAGLPIGRVPAEYMSDDATPSQQAVFEYMKAIVTRIKRDEQEGLVIPSDCDERGNKLFDISLLTTGGRRQFEIDKLIERFDVKILTQIFADFLMLGHERTGSFALSNSKTDVFALAVSAVVKAILGVFNRYAIPRLIKANAIDSKYTPTMESGDVETPVIEDVAKIIDALVKGGSTLFLDETDGPTLENALLRLVNLPQRSTQTE